MEFSYTTSLSRISAADWDALVGTDNPFVRYAFLSNLGHHHCLQPFGWQPLHVLVHEGERLIGAMPLYAKGNSYGEFVFDWSWASAYEQMTAQAYYPKMVCSVPYTPVSGPRLLVADQVDKYAVQQCLLAGAKSLAREVKASSLHILFSNADDTDFLQAQPELMMRKGCQFHWENAGYRDFNDYLDAMVSKKRKQIKRERRDAGNCGVTIEVLDGHTATEQHWRIFHQFYESTFDRKSGTPTLTCNFFQALARDLPEAIVLIMAHKAGEYVAGAFNLRGTQTLFGRHWGCSQHFRHLHFEVCYYCTIDYCLTHGLQRFEAGAQGEHKLGRGFLPQATWSAHWIDQPDFAAVVANFLNQETPAIDSYIDNLKQHSPFRQDAVCPEILKVT